ncbi:hypothetical protein BDD12DRAFT_358487 [Trichophaea hybrida]|nr:hypothetical protein BDD12DRAFT_542171 [Trichophaea hybrida]KAF8542514.1 hypothetical protein BDD12DRAFT_358487 [Trichophaea hybrida]
MGNHAALKKEPLQYVGAFGISHNFHMPPMPIIPPPPLPPPPLPPPQPHQCTPASTTVVTVSGISCKRTLELCPSCAPACTSQKLIAIVEADRKECWIAASVVDIGTVGSNGRWLGCRYKIDPLQRPWWRRGSGRERGRVRRGGCGEAADTIT